MCPINCARMERSLVKTKLEMDELRMQIKLPASEEYELGKRSMCSIRHGIPKFVVSPGQVQSKKYLTFRHKPEMVQFAAIDGGPFHNLKA